MTERTSRAGRWFWGGFIAVLLLGVLITLFAAIRGGTRWLDEQLAGDALPPAWSAVIRVTLHGGETLYLDHESVVLVRSELRDSLQGQLQEAQSDLQRGIDQGLDEIFVLAEAGVPAFADWYFSLRGEYARLAYAAAGELGPYLAERVEELVFEPAGTAQAIDKLTAGLDQAVADQLRGTALAVQERIASLVRVYHQPEAGAELRVTGEWDLNRQLGERFRPYIALTPTDIARQGLATSAGAAASAVTAKKLGGAAVAKAAGQMGAKTSLATLAGLASKLGLKSAVKAGAGAGTGAAAGAAVCAATGVGLAVAPGCALVGGVIAGVGVWLLVDTAVIEAEEYLHRDELEADLRQALVQQRESLRATLHERYVGGVSTAFKDFMDSIETGIQPISPEKGFVPADAVSRTGVRESLGEPGMSDDRAGGSLANETKD